MSIKAVVLMTALAHVLCGITDCLMIYLPKGRFSFRMMNDPKKMARIFEGKSETSLMVSILLGVLSLTLCFFGYMKLAQWMESFSRGHATAMYIAGVLFFLPGIAHHVICGSAEWFYVHLGRTREALGAVNEYFRRSSLTMYVCYLGLLIYSGALFAAVFTGRTDLPGWAYILNPMLIGIPLLIFRIPAAVNIAGFITFLGLFFVIV